MFTSLSVAQNNFHLLIACFALTLYNPRSYHHFGVLGSLLMGSQQSTGTINVSAERLAHHFWEERSCPLDEPLVDWHVAERLLTTLRPYLSLVAAELPK